VDRAVVLVFSWTFDDRALVTSHIQTRRVLGGVAVGTALLVVALAFTVVPSIAAGGLLHPMRVALYSPTPPGCAEREFAGRRTDAARLEV
jgi:hypothetical protein